MDQFILQDKMPQDRVAILEKMAAKAEKITYRRNLTEAEIEAESKNLADAVTRRAQIEDEKKEVTKEYNKRIEEQKTKAETISDTLLSGTREETRLCYKFVNIDTKEVGYYNELGELVKVRPAMDQDMQLDMFGAQGASEQADAGALHGKTPAALPEDNHPEAEDVEFEDVTK